METLLLIAAEARELRGVASHLPPAIRLQWPVAHAHRAEHQGRTWILVANGPGPVLAGQAVDAAMDRVCPDIVVSTGFCGGLDPALQAGNIFVADRVVSSGSGEEFAALRPAGSEGEESGSIACGDRVVQTVEEKAELRRRTGAKAVDMESSAVAARASRTGIPFYCLRVVLDSAVEPFTIDFNAARDPGGRFRSSAILAQALRRPWVRLPELVRLESRSRRAADRLGEFLVNCRY